MMRIWAGFLATAFLTTPAHADEQLARALERAGYFTSIDNNVATRLRRDIVADGPAGAMRHPYRVATVNTQSFAQGGVGAWVQSLAPVLASRGVTFQPAQDRLTAENYTVAIGGNEYVMWRAGEANTEAAATAGAFAMINHLLESIGAPERLYMIGEGAAAQAWLLTPAQAEIIRTAAPEANWPRLPGQVMPAHATPASTDGSALSPQALSAESSAQPLANEASPSVQPR